MPTHGSITKTIRINPRDLEIIEELMKDGTTWSGAIHKLCEGVPQKEAKKSEGVPKDKGNVIQSTEKGSIDGVHRYRERMRSDAAPFGMTEEEFANKLLDGVDSGAISYEDGAFVARDYDLSRLEEACRIKGVPVEKMIEKVVQMVWGM